MFIIGGYKFPHTTRELFKKCINDMINSCKIDKNSLVIIGDCNEDCFSNKASWLEKYMNEYHQLNRALSSGISTTNFNTQIDVIFSNLVDYVSGTYESILTISRFFFAIKRT